MNNEMTQSQTVETIETEQTMEATETVQPTETVLTTKFARPTTFVQLAGFNQAIIEDRLKKEAKKPKPFGVPQESTCIYRNDWGDSIYAVKLACGATQKVSFTVVDRAGNPRGAYLTTHSRLLGNDGFKFVLDLVGDFDRSDMMKVREHYQNVHTHLKSIRCDDRVPFDVVYAELSETEEKADIVTKTPTKDGDYINIAVDKFKQIVEKGDWGWKPLEVKRMLRDLGLLRVNKDRPFDYAVTDSKGTPYRTISIKLGMNGEGANKP